MRKLMGTLLLAALLMTLAVPAGPAQELPKGAMLLTIFLRHDQSKTVD
jgi:hypothetical protein